MASMAERRPKTATVVTAANVYRGPTGARHFTPGSHMIPTRLCEVDIIIMSLWHKLRWGIWVYLARITQIVRGRVGLPTSKALGLDLKAKLFPFLFQAAHLSHPLVPAQIAHFQILTRRPWKPWPQRCMQKTCQQSIFYIHQILRSCNYIKQTFLFSSSNSMPF